MRRDKKVQETLGRVACARCTELIPAESVTCPHCDMNFSVGIGAHAGGRSGGCAYDFAPTTIARQKRRRRRTQRAVILMFIAMAGLVILPLIILALLSML